MGRGSYARLSKYSLSYYLPWETRKVLRQDDGCGVTLPGCGFYPTLFYYIYFTLQCSSSCSILTFESVATGNKTELKRKHINWMLLHFSYVRLSPILGSFCVLRQGVNLRVMLRGPDVQVCNLVLQSRLFLPVSFMVFFQLRQSNIEILP